MFLKSYGRPFLGLTPTNTSTSQVPTSADSGTLSSDMQANALAASTEGLNEELVDKEARDKLKRMCEGYFETISKKLVKEHLVSVCLGIP